MATYSVNMTNVQEIATQMGVVSNQVKNLLDELTNNTQSHLAEWSADSRVAFQNAKQIWDQKAADMAMQATAAQNALGQINDTYANAEYQGLGLWGQ